MSEWTSWAGGECPVGRYVMVDVKWSDGRVLRDTCAGGWGWNCPDIVAYRLTEKQSMEEAYEQAHKPINDSALDVQVGGDHYKKCGIQPITYIHANKIGFMEGNAIKYLSRWRDKGGVDDLKKARHYIEMLIELEGK